MWKNILKIIAIFVIGTVGGIFADQILCPYFIERPLFYQYRLEQQPVYVTERKEIVIRENTALEQAIEKVEKTVVGLKTKTLAGSGLIVTSDGLVVTLANLVPKGTDLYIWIDGEWPAFQILKRDLENNLALIKIEKANLPTVGFADFEKIQKGERIFFVSVNSPLIKGGAIRKIVNEGIIKSFDENLIETNISETAEVAGSPLFDIEGNLVGLVEVTEKGNVNAIPVKKIRQFLGF